VNGARVDAVVHRVELSGGHSLAIARDRQPGGPGRKKRSRLSGAGTGAWSVSRSLTNEPVSGRKLAAPTNAGCGPILVGEPISRNVWGSAAAPELPRPRRSGRPLSAAPPRPAPRQPPSQRGEAVRAGTCSQCVVYRAAAGGSAARNADAPCMARYPFKGVAEAIRPRRARAPRPLPSTRGRDRR
jgi:hypothetical protein